MIIFIDESGDAGFKAKSSPHFVIALVIFDDPIEAEETALRIKKLKRTLGKSDKFEFKFNKTNSDFRKKFLQEIKDCKFRVRSIVVKKSVVKSPEMRKKKETFYNYFLGQVIKHNNSTISKAKIRLDGRGEREVRRALITYLRKISMENSSNQSLIKNIKFKDSKSDVLIQLADMLAGSIRKSYTEDSDSKAYKEIVEERIDDEWVFK